MKATFFGLFAAGILVATPAMSATVITFDPYSNLGVPVDEVVVGDFTFDVIDQFGGGSQLYVLPTDNGGTADNGTNVIAYSSGTLRVEKTRGRPGFLLNSIDFGRGPGLVVANPMVDYRLFLTDGTVKAGSFALTSEFSTISFGGDSITTALFTGFRGSYVSFDNLSYGPPSVPEPATWAMMLMGFGIVGIGLRRPQAVRRLRQLQRT